MWQYLNSQNSINMHKESFREGAKYMCNICDYEATDKGNLKET